MPPQVALEAPPVAQSVQPKVLAGNGIKPEVEPEEQEQEEQYEDVLEEKDKSDLGECFVTSNGKSNLLECTWSIPIKSAQTA